MSQADRSQIAKVRNVISPLETTSICEDYSDGEQDDYEVLENNLADHDAESD